MRSTFIRSLTKFASQDSDIMLLTGDLGFNVLENFEKNFPSQFLNCGIAEQNMMGMAAGLASEGKKVFVYSIANFPTFRCLEQIRNDICYHNFPVTIVSIGAGFSYGSLGYSHHAVEDIAIMRSLPGLRLLSPNDPFEVEECMQIIIKNPLPTYLRLGKDGEPNIINSSKLNIKGLNFLNEKFDNLILSTGPISNQCFKIVNKLNTEIEKKFTFATITQLKPIEIKAVDLKIFKRIVTIEEHSLIGGLGSTINDFVIKNNLKMDILNIGISEYDQHEMGSTEYLRQVHGLDQKSIFEKINNFIKN